MPIGHKEHKKIPTQTHSGPDDIIETAALETERVVGTGGTADVVKMTNTQSGETVAVKQPQLKDTLNKRVVDKFLEEAKMWENLSSHDNIVDVVNWEENPVPRIILEYMDGGPLTDRVGEMPHSQALWTSVCVADAVWEAHRQGVAHLDLKPDNILFRSTTEDCWDVPKVGDWGVARLLLHHSQDVTELSPQYSAPEQFSPDTYGQPDNVTDIYQLGVIVYELLVGDPLFSGRASTVMNKHLTKAPTPPTDLNNELPTSVNHVLQSALAKEKDDRYESMLDFRRDLTALFHQIVLNETPSFVSQELSTRWNEVTKERSPTGAVRSKKPRDTDQPGESVAPFESEDGVSGVLDSIQAQSDSEPDHRIPWQRRNEASKLERDVDGTLKRNRHAISSQMSERLQEVPEEGRGDETTTAGLAKLFVIIKQILQRR